VKDGNINFKRVFIRQTERGPLSYQCYVQKVWLFSKKGKLREERLLIRKEEDGKVTYSLSNAPGNISLAVLAKWRQGRYFVERIFQEVKSEIGWDELEARKYRSWIHHTALCALALWFAMKVKWRWNKKFPRDSNLKKELEVEKLPELSVANIRELLITVLPLKTLSCKEAMNLVVKKLVARAKSTRSRIRKHKSIIQKKGA